MSLITPPFGPGGFCYRTIYYLREHSTSYCSKAAGTTATGIKQTELSGPHYLNGITGEADTNLELIFIRLPLPRPPLVDRTHLRLERTMRSRWAHCCFRVAVALDRLEGSPYRVAKRRYGWGVLSIIVNELRSDIRCMAVMEEPASHANTISKSSTLPHLSLISYFMRS